MKRAAIAIAAALAITVSATGCAPELRYDGFDSLGIPSADGPSSGGTADSGRPSVSQCWTSSVSTISHNAVWPGPSHVSCANPHQSITFHVGELSGFSTGSWEKSGSSPVTVSPDVISAAGRECSANANTLGTSRPAILFPSFFIPSQAQWASGARWVRCDISQFKLGSSVYNAQLVDLPATLEAYLDAVSAHPAAYKLCINEPGSDSNTGPFTHSTSTYADCTKSPQWTRRALGQLPGDAYPTASALKGYIHPRCGAKFDTPTVRATIIFPNRTQWAAGSRAWECWTTVRAAR